MKLYIPVFSLALFMAISAFAQPASTASFGHRLDAMGGCYSVIEGEGNAVDIYDISSGENPAASHSNEARGIPIEWLDKIGGADRYSMDVSFRNLEYRGPDDNNGEKRSWYWVDGVSRIMVEKGFESRFSMRMGFNGGYETIRKSWQDGYAPWPNELRHNYSASTFDWSDLHVRAATSGASAMVPLGEFYGTYHFPFGLSLGAGGGYGFSEFEDLSYYSGWQTMLKGNVGSYRAKFGARYAYPDLSDYFAVGLNYNIAGGKVNNEKDDDYTVYDDDDSHLGLQAEFGYPDYFEGAFGYESAKLAEKRFQSATDTSADEATDDVTSTRFKLHFTGDGINIPIVIGLDMKNWSTAGENASENIDRDEGVTAFGISSEPVADMLIFAAQYEIGQQNYSSSADTAQLDFSRISFGTEIYPVREFGVRLGFEIVDFQPDDAYESLYRGYIMPYVGPVTRLNFVPDIEKGNALTGGFVLRIADERLILEFSGRHYFADEPTVYKENAANRDEGFFGLTYYLK